MNRIALKMLFGDRGKYLGIITGITLASILMIQQPGMLVSIFTMTYSFITDVSLPNIWVMDAKVQQIDDSKPLLDTQLYRVRGVRGVEWAVPLYKGSQKVRLSNGETVMSNLLGLDDATLIGGPAVMIKGKLSDLRIPDSVIVDEAGANGRLAKPAAAPGEHATPLKVGDVLELNEKRALVVGIARAQKTFQSQPIIYTTYTRAKVYANSERKMLTYILVKAKDNEPRETIARRITQNTRLAAWTAEEFKKKSLNYMIYNTSIIINFGFVVLVGFVIGAAVTGQMFYNFTLDNLRYFAVFKAMGTTDQTLRRMILLQALLVGFVGYGIGAGAIALFAMIMGNSNGPSVNLSWQLLLTSGCAILLIVLMSALVCIRKVLKLEAAVVFKG
ncbi:ABC transporter permease [Desulfobulbus sp.]|uniref:ABC transporter permease n=1 Tax=Desulfobulbus sp. TaxID=895 RepID=UPI0027B8C6D3|nr:ABC transporter permease [Desulfobulbus sp.]